MIENWITEINLVTDRFQTSFSHFTEEEMNFKPDERSWSVAQNLAHLILLNSSYFEYFKEIQEGSHTLPEGENLETTAQSSLNALTPFTSSKRPKRTNTWDKWQPPSNLKDRNMLNEFGQSQSEFRKHIQNFDGFSLASTFIKYPGHFDLLFKLDDCIDFLIEHENRHWNQAMEIKL